MIQAAIRRELAPGRQVFFVHNRVRNLATWARYVQEMVPEARVAMAHGQMPERELEKVMVRFWRKEVDVLVCTAIIEAGLDIPAANTIIINRAHTMGLAQLYQLRGRVGRSQAQAYAYLLVPEEAALSSEAQKRLKALMEFTELGSRLQDRHARPADPGRRQSPGPGPVRARWRKWAMSFICNSWRRPSGSSRASPEDLAPDPEIRLPLAAYLPEDYVPGCQAAPGPLPAPLRPPDPGHGGELEAEFRIASARSPGRGSNLLEVVRPSIACGSWASSAWKSRTALRGLAVCRSRSAWTCRALWPC